MIDLKRYLHRRLTGRETVFVVFAVAVLAGFGYLAYNFIAAEILEAGVNAATPKVCADIRHQRAKLIAAIEAYKAHFGTYPPDHVLSRHPLVVDPVTNTLFYELVGVIYNPTNKMFQVGGMEPAEEKYVKEFFQIDGFRNCAQRIDQIKPFLSVDPLPARQLHDDPDVFVAGFAVPYDGLASEVIWAFDPSSWRYVSSSPTNNPGGFDLWMELKTKDRSVVIGNWKTVE